MPDWLGTFLAIYACISAVAFLGGGCTLWRLERHQQRSQPAAGTRALGFVRQLLSQPGDLVWLLIISLGWPVVLGASLYLFTRSRVLALSRGG